MEPIYKKAKKKIALKRNTMKFFKFDENNEIFMVDILNNMHFFLAIDYAKCGMLFQQTIVVIRHAKDRLKMQKLGGINDHNVNQYIRALVATNMNKIMDMLLHPLVWAFSIAKMATCIVIVRSLTCAFAFTSATSCPICTWLPCFKMGNGLKLSTCGACTCVARKSSSWI
jgi:hypothetical protein